MICFKKKDEELYLVTNYKVMFSTLTKQKDIEHIHISKELSLKIILSYFHLNESKFYLLVRNPYKRLESFFKDKFRQTIKNNEEKREWQHCHKIFFPNLGLDESLHASIIAEKLLNVTFSEFISLLPISFQKDGHLHPQHWAKSFKMKKIKLPIKYKRVFKMESKKDLENMAKLFNVNLDIKSNSTKLVQERITWKHAELNIVKKIYKEDFEKFKYKKMTVTNK